MICKFYWGENLIYRSVNDPYCRVGFIKMFGREVGPFAKLHGVLNGGNNPHWEKLAAVETRLSHVVGFLLKWPNESGLSRSFFLGTI